MTETLRCAAGTAGVVAPPAYANDRGEALWEGAWGRVAVAPIDLDDPASSPTVSLDVTAGLECGMDPEMGRRLAAAVAAACDAATGQAMGWRQYHAESPPRGEPDPDHPGMVQVGPGHWEGLARHAETFNIVSVERFSQDYRAAGRQVTVYARTFRTLTDITAWEPVHLVIDGGSDHG